MSASFMNPDAQQINHDLSAPQLRMAQFIEEAALARIKELLTRMGVSDLTREDTMQTMASKITQHKISVTHLAGVSPEQDGWWFLRNGKAEIHLLHPIPDDNGYVNFPARFIV